MQEQEAWFRSLEDGFADQARAAGGQIERSYQVAGLTARLRFAGAGLMPLIEPALRHLEAAGGAGTATLTVLVGHGASGMPPLPRSRMSLSPRGDIVGFNTPRFKTALQPPGEIVTAFDAERALAVYWVGDLDAYPLSERVAPMRGLFGWWMRSRGRQLVHAAAVGTREGCVLLGGKGGSGKSNTALACLQSGLGYASDDFCAIDPAPLPVAYSLYAAARTACQDWERLPFLRAMATTGGLGNDDKAAYFLHPHYAERLVTRMPVRAIVLPNARDRRPLGLRRGSWTEAVMALAPCTTSLLPDAGAEVVENICAAVRRLPCYRLDLGSDIAKVPALIRELLALP